MAATMRYKFLAGRTSISDPQRFLATLDTIALASQTTIQAVDASKIAGQQHIDYAVGKAIASFKDHSNIARDVGVEILLQLSACRQIQKALNMGVHTGTMEVVFIVVGTTRSIAATIKELSGLVEPDESVIDYRETKRVALMSAFMITDAEINAAGGPQTIPVLIRERIALFNAFK